MNEPAAETYDVFIVHAQDDLEWARQVQARLSEDGFRAALEDYLPGDIIVRRIEELIRASRTCVFVYSRAIEADPMADAKYAALVSEAEARRFVPALLDDVPLGPFAASRKPLDFRGEDRDGPYRELLRVLGVDRSAGIPLPSHRRHRLEGAREVLLGIGRDAVVFAPGESQEVSHRPEPFTRALEERVWQLDRVRRGGGGLPVPTKDGAVAGRPGALLETRLGEAGTELGETFLAGSAGEALAAAIVEAEAENRALRLGLQVDDEFAGLPWETLVLPGQAEPLALHPHVELFRHLPGAGCPTAMRILAPLRILAVVAAPEGPDSGPLLDLEAELGVILDSVEEARRHAAAHVRILNEGTLDAIETALKQERFHVLHVSCHAGPDALLLEDEHGGTDRVTAARLAGAIPRDRGVPLVVLSGCSTALDVREGDGGAALAGLARGLSAAGVPAVLAMTAPVTDRYATLLSGALYRELAVRPEPDVLAALSEARRSLALHEDLGDQVGMAAGYSQLGVLAYQRMEFDRALEYYGRALAITERHGNRAGMAVGYNQIGGLHTEAGRAAEALAYTVAGLVIQVELQSPDVRNSLYWLGRQRELLGEGEFGRLLAEYLDAESVNTVIGWLDRPPG